KYFFPSLARTVSGNFIPADVLMRDEYCAECHEDTHRQWSHSMHRFASFNNPAYLFSVRNTRAFAMARDGNVRAARFCAACHDPVPFFSGAFDDPDFDDVEHPTAHAGITCTSCHAISHINSQRGNGDYTIEEPLHYPFIDSDSKALQWVNRFLVKSKPEFHKRSFLKPLHKTAEFCAGCHKVHLPEELNGYKWLRGQNHYDAWLLSGVSGHGVSSFYYPPTPEKQCNGCHMSLQVSDDFGARYLDDTDELKIHDHQFPSANTAIPYLLGMPDEVTDAHRSFLKGSLWVDIFGLRRGGTIDGELIAPLRPVVPSVQPGETYLLEVVVRTLTLGHLFTQGTADSNEVWLDVEIRDRDRQISRSGGFSDADNTVDPDAHFVNAYVIDRDGNRIDRRNAEDIFTTLYNNQIPPGAADVVHYRFTVPETASGTLEVGVRLKYRKFDTTFMRHFQGDEFDGNDLPIVVIADDVISLPVASEPENVEPAEMDTWQRWNDYGIGLLRKGGAGQLRQAEVAFREVESLGRADGAVNLARVYLREGRLDDAVKALRRASRVESPAYPWTVMWFTSLVNKQNGYLDEAIDGFKALVDTQFTEAQARGFDFSRDYRLLNELADTVFERAKLERGDSATARRNAMIDEARQWYEAALAVDPENVTAHYGLAQVHAALGNDDQSESHRQLHAKYKPDDNAMDRAVGLARRRDPAANRAADAVVIYDLMPLPADQRGAGR
ncbi:MAG: tetratricopeptide repeat protein, partial [Gammaproteobacteria bacterium]|nr:tetratricopeptide repeat protein [Gammaproteobacteria bacterium]